jgi:DNA-binding NarL/FixJ family response regulator
VVVVQLIAEGNANKHIADQLAITKDTVKDRATRAFRRYWTRTIERTRRSSVSATASLN